MKTVVIVGGGLAGLAAGVDLVDRGLRVCVLEARADLGGRAYSFPDEESGENVDNGQHAMMGCYHHTFAFLRRIGAEGKVFRQPNLHVPFRHREAGAGEISCPAWPGPFHALAGILRYRLLSPRERGLALLGGVRILAMHRRKDPRLTAMTVEEVMELTHQSPRAREAFWYPVVIATLNETPDRAAARPFAEVLLRAFFGSRADSQFVLPRVGLSDLYTADARRYIEARGGTVRTGCRVESMPLAGSRLTAVRLREGEEVGGDVFLSTVPPRALLRFLPETLQKERPFRGLEGIGVAPIVSSHLWLDRPVMEEEFVGLLGTRTHWLFNRSRLVDGGRSAGGGQFVSAVISAGHEEATWTNERVLDQVLADMRALLPTAVEARLLRGRVVKEKSATISVTPAVERIRPDPATPLANFFLAGDWTNTGLPPTIESAVMSGQRVAALLAKHGG